MGNKQTKINYDYMKSTSSSLIAFVGTSEHYRKKFSEKLRAALQQNDDLNNQLFEFAQNKQLNQISYEIVHKKLQMLYESINAISNAKNLEDKYQFEITNQKELIETLKAEKVQLECEHRETFKLKDQYADDCKELSDAKNKIEKQMFIQAVNAKETSSKLHSQLMKANADLEEKVNELMKLEKMWADLKQENQRQKQRIQKLKSRKGRMDVGFKQCKKCQKEYTEKENFKWVCRTHQSIYNEKDDIWWCCSKKGKN